MIDHIKKVEKFIDKKIDILKADKSFEYYLLDYKKVRGKFKNYNGYGFPMMKQRWCTLLLKQVPINNYLKNIDDNYIQYIGIAADEPKRLKVKIGICYPLAEWGITEKDALIYCYQKGFYWNGLYEKFKRVSCWCCPMQGLNELKNLYRYYPDLWSKLLEMDNKAYNSFRYDYTLEHLSKRFKREIYIDRNQISFLH